MTAAAAAPDLVDGLRRMWARSRHALLATASDLEDAVAAASAGELDDAARSIAEGTAHKLIGSAGAFGFLRAAAVARDLEQRFSQGPLEGEAIVACAELVEELAAELDVDQPPLVLNSAGSTPAESDHGRTVLVVDADDQWRQDVAIEASSHGLDVVHAASASAAEAKLAEAPCAVAVVRLDDAAGRESMQLLAKLETLDRSPVTVVIGDGQRVMDRVEASRRGVDRFLGSSHRPDEVVSTILELIEAENDGRHRILMVDDDDVMLDLGYRLLGGEGLEVATLNDPRRLWEVLDSFRPDLVVLDWQMPGVTGGELCRALRADPSWSALPVLVLTAHRDGSTLTEAFRAGADDFVAKPVVGPELVGRIHNRLERLRLLQELADREVLTGLPHRRAGHRDLAQLLVSAAKSSEPVAVAMVEIDNLAALCRSAGNDVGDRLLVHVASSLRRSFRGREVVAAWSRERFVVGMFGMRAADGVARVAEVFEQIERDPIVTAAGRRITVTLSGGVAEFSADGDSVDALVWKADDAATKAAQYGGSQVLRASAAHDAEEKVIDVAIVEDDEQLAELLGHALTTRGLQYRWFRDGVDAAQALVGDDTHPPELQPRVVLLDVNLPGLSGMAVLRRMAESDALSRSRVVMLTARSAEEEVVAALSLGASDHVAKPFSVPVLMERLRHQLDRD